MTTWQRHRLYSIKMKKNKANQKKLVVIDTAEEKATTNAEATSVGKNSPPQTYHNQILGKNVRVTAARIKTTSEMGWCRINVMIILHKSTVLWNATSNPSFRFIVSSASSESEYHCVRTNQISIGQRFFSIASASSCDKSLYKPVSLPLIEAWWSSTTKLKSVSHESQPGSTSKIRTMSSICSVELSSSLMLGRIERPSSSCSSRGEALQSSSSTFFMRSICASGNVTVMPYSSCRRRHDSKDARL
mmetsp:Transcript_45721/g.72320  ORF Transcript_45721/g.72320 Transcript_45721/m.72320 type:complete len:246 (+) Transcript_45721:561-1298(+)